MDNDNLYINVKNKIRDMIFDGIYLEGEKIPPERTLAETLKVSRVTIRRALEILEKEQLIKREVGNGTSIEFHNYGNEVPTDMIILLAPARNPFFASFIEQFQIYANKHGSLVLYVEKPEHDTLERCLYRLLCKGIHNAVVWPDDIEVDGKKLKKLRALGMNMVFFDTNAGMPYADCVHVDNEKGIKVLYDILLREGIDQVGYIGWDKEDVFGVSSRKKAFLENGVGMIVGTVSWENRKDMGESLEKQFQVYMDTHGRLPEGFVCADGELGIETVKVLKRMQADYEMVTSVDEFEYSGKYGITTYGQDIEESVHTVYDCLLRQKQLRKDWKAEIYALEGTIKERHPIKAP